MVTYIDFAAALDSVSHKFLDAALQKAGASRKSRAIFRSIYTAAAGTERVRVIDGQVVSQSFAVRRGVIQGDFISLVLFVLALDELVQVLDTQDNGVSVGCIQNLRRETQDFGWLCLTQSSGLASL